MLRIVQLEGESLIAEVRRPAFAHDWVEHAKTASAQVVERLAGATIAITNKVAIDAAAVNALPDLKMIAVSATGTNNVDLDACRARGIVVSNIQGYAVHTVPEHVMALLLALSRNLVAWRETLLAGGWQRSEQFCLFDHPIRDLHGATLGLIGSGTLGSGVARLAEAFGMRVLRAEHKGATAVRPGYTAFAEVLATADAISLHCPLTAETKDLIGETELRAMRPSALLINTARGGIVNEPALIRALREGWIAGAGFDAITAEPPPADHPMVDPALLALPNFLLTPHVAWSSRPAMQTLADQLIDNIEAFVAGAPKNRVA
ncbi:MAG: D-2-hydroxyacid dehydrogenase [Gammaproteobacteria bacterium]|nr:D-2-hydroxyacid dehydrogenase [Gammaproteobacteria bacterium]MBU1602951.1 D-2-hydroxyacid dehydrogenase [Gammaproteobacteria bacterium]MBU2434803.1 D-2-hydroxyacid dehydrogenase [Gammaproteobacteria bacterium]MBU2448834.1 D-2-hydroxyacid dehydrogenase [Gammaproteobacteria bacterium]